MTCHSRLAATISAAAITLIPAFGVIAPAAAATPREVTTWFAALTLEQVEPYMHNFPSWSSEGTNDPKALSFGDPSRTLAYSLPAYNLGTDAVTGSTGLAAGLTPTGGYCARALVDQKPIDVVVCAEPTADGSGYHVSEASEVHFLDTSADLPAAGTTEPDHDFVAVVDGAVVPMDQAAQAWMGTTRLDGSTFIRLAAKQKAEWAAINRHNGPTVGGGIPLTGAIKPMLPPSKLPYPRAQGYQWPGSHTRGPLPKAPPGTRLMSKPGSFRPSLS